MRVAAEFVHAPAELPLAGHVSVHERAGAYTIRHTVLVRVIGAGWGRTGPRRLPPRCSCSASTRAFRCKTSGHVQSWWRCGTSIGPEHRSTGVASCLNSSPAGLAWLLAVAKVRQVVAAGSGPVDDARR